MAIDTKDFLNLVADEVKGRASLHQRRFLEQSPERWLAAIEELLGELDQQLQHLDVRLTTVRQAADAGTLALHLAVQDELDLQRRVGKATTFRLNVERRLAEVRDLFADLSELSPAEQRVRMLERAIRTHRELLAVVDDDQAEAVDEALWAVLDGEWRFPEAA
ncbi:MAG: hypothetical protein F2534_19105 [Actinobacteria bacterium]|uniref:Unannotated protein n=1 Tax=freshwater metagenome TaxID=449393 RepID=A0A6J6FTE4_9ZZZZ|nr:hypothetical protein [Actinomycetota bacterium]